MLGPKVQMFCAGALAVFTLLHLKSGDTDKAMMPAAICLLLIVVNTLDERNK